MHIHIELLNVAILGCYVLCNSVHVMHCCDLKHLDLHLVFYLLRFLNYYFSSPDLSKKRQLLISYFVGSFLEGKVLAKGCRSFQVYRTDS